VAAVVSLFLKGVLFLPWFSFTVLVRVSFYVLGFYLPALVASSFIVPILVIAGAAWFTIVCIK
jgi:hypothetical protein